MNVSLQTAMGLRVYRELIDKETSSPMRWAQTFGVDQQLKEQPAERLIKLNGFDAAVALPQPLTLQLFALQREKIKAIREGAAWEEKSFPFKSTFPVSASSVEVWGKEKAEQQRPMARPTTAPTPSMSWPGAPHSRGEPNVTKPMRQKNAWAIDNDYFKREIVGPAHWHAWAAKA